MFSARTIPRHPICFSIMQVAGKNKTLAEKRSHGGRHQNLRHICSSGMNSSPYLSIQAAPWASIHPPAQRQLWRPMHSKAPSERTNTSNPTTPYTHHSLPSSIPYPIPPRKLPHTLYGHCFKYTKDHLQKPHRINSYTVISPDSSTMPPPTTHISI